MKKLLFLVLSATLGTAAFSQEFRLNGYAAYTFDDDYNESIDANTYYHGKVTGGFQWGGGVQYLPHPGYGVELLYLQRNTTAPTTFKRGVANPQQQESFDIALHYIMLSMD